MIITMSLSSEVDIFDIVINNAADHPVEWPHNFHIGFELASLDEVRALYEQMAGAGVVMKSGVLILLCHKIKTSSQPSAAWTGVEPRDQSHRKFVADGGNRVSRVALCASDFPAQCNRREPQVSGVLRSFFWR
ncbi:hypothetical protein B0G82_7338 [Paraburkholderia sp. BL17N1]|nr:hypothetical protein B0G82_7338 [Paraburkholderia sp. BL17N1]